MSLSQPIVQALDSSAQAARASKAAIDNEPQRPRAPSLRNTICVPR
jgi:hypothetical protein